MDDFIRLYKDQLVIEACKEKNGQYDLRIWYDITAMINSLPTYIDKVLVHVLDICTDEEINRETRKTIQEIIEDIESHKDDYYYGEIEFTYQVKICFKDESCLYAYSLDGGAISIFKDI